MKRNVSAFVAGLIFAIGLGMSGMLQPARILGFLDVLGEWDPSLAFAMGGAVAVGLVTYRLVMRRRRPVFDTSFHVPQSQRITPSLVGGSALFGVGWGLSGYCPGPAIVASVLGHPVQLAILAAILIGILGARYLVQTAFWTRFAPSESGVRSVSES
jgi:uncharacterized membrane protein YedE/YeeE